MIPLTRGDIEVLLDHPSQTDYVVSAYADLRVRDGFHRYVETELKNLEKQLLRVMSTSEARRLLDANLEPIRRAVRDADPSLKGLAVFSSVARELFHVVPLDRAIDNYLVVDEEPYALPLLERWFGDPHYFVATIASREVRLFEVHSGTAEAAGSLERNDENTERVIPDRAGRNTLPTARFTYKRAHSQTLHEKLKGLDDDAFVKEIAAELTRRWQDRPAHWGLVLVGLAPLVAAVRRLLPPEIDRAVIVLPEGVPLPTETTIDAVLQTVLDNDRNARRVRVLDDLRSRLSQNHLIARGAVEVLDALQQGRATGVALGPRRDIGGARCTACNYRFGAPVGVCTYCGAETHLVNAVQEILRMALRQNLRVHVLKRNPGDPPDILAPLEAAGDVAAVVKAPANWSESNSPPATATRSTPATAP